MRKKFGAMLTAGIMACTMAASLVLATGCGAGIKPTFDMPEEGFDTSKKVTITFYHTMGQNLQGVLDYYIGEFQKLYPNVTVKHSQEGGYDDVRDKIATQIQVGNQPNIAYCYPDHVALFNDYDAVQTLNDFLPGGAYADWTVTQTNADGTTTEVPLGLSETEKGMFIDGYYKEGYKFGNEKYMYTLPFSKSTEVLYYDVTFFEEHNLKVPTTWNEMEEVCKLIRVGDPENGIEPLDPNSIPLGYDSEANWFITMCEQLESDYTSSSGNNFRFNNKTNKDFVTRFKGWYDKKYVTTQELYGSYTSKLFTNVGAQRAYMCIGSSAGATNQVPTATDDGYPFAVGIAPIPQAYSTDPNHPEYKAGYEDKVISQGPSVCIFKQTDPQEVLASWLFVKYLTTNIEFQAEFSGISGYVPVLKEEYMRQNAVFARKLDAAKNSSEENPMANNTNIAALSAWVCMQQENAYYTSPAFLGSSTARDEVGNLMQAVFTGRKNVDTAFSDAIRACKAAIL